MLFLITIRPMKTRSDIEMHLSHKLWIYKKNSLEMILSTIFEAAFF